MSDQFPLISESAPPEDTEEINARVRMRNAGYTIRQAQESVDADTQAYKAIVEKSKTHLAKPPLPDKLS